MPTTITIEVVRDVAALGDEWRTLEARAAPHSFFQTWSWVGCLAAERFPDPVLLRAHDAGRVVGLALWNRYRGALCLHESGIAALDGPFIEHNAPLLAQDAGPEVLPAMLREAWRAGGVRRLVLRGVAPALVALAGGAVLRRQDRVAPFVDLGGVRAAGGDHVATLSANARYQVRRSLRHYQALGDVRVERAADGAQAASWFEPMLALHGATWRARGKPGAFADPFMRRFHQALIAEALPRDAVDLLRARAGDATIGYLYNFRHQGRVFAYQSGFSPEGAGVHGKPGITCHVLAIARALAAGDAAYDFLGGADRYKTSLANAQVTLAWTEHVRRWSLPGIAARLLRR
jgi:CelD/BcsL family acetyltransferase involved in cellulose biosynthesis